MDECIDGHGPYEILAQVLLGYDGIGVCLAHDNIWEVTTALDMWQDFVADGI